MLVFSVENQIRFHHHAAWRAVRAEWLGYGPNRGQRAALLRAAAFCRAHPSVTGWIIDLRHTEGAMVSHDPDWLARVFNPAMASTGVRDFINVLPPRLVLPDGLNRWEQAGRFRMADVDSLEQAGALLSGAAAGRIAVSLDAAPMAQS